MIMKIMSALIVFALARRHAVPVISAVCRILSPAMMAGFVMLASPGFGAESTRVRESFDFGWRFSLGEHADAQSPAFDDAAWRKLDVPHDWSIEGNFSEREPSGNLGGYLPTGIGWYRKHFKVPATLRGKQISVQFDGVYANSDVWLNGHHLGRWPYGYTTFHYDLTPYLKYGDEANVIAVRADNSVQPASRWYTGAGIYRHVWLTVTAPVHVAQWGVYVTTPAVSKETASLRIRTLIQNKGAAEAGVTLTSEILDQEGRLVATSESSATVPAAGEHEAEQTITLESPRLWSVEAPNLYRVRSVLAYRGNAVDETVTTFGVRSIVYDVDRGLLLNNQSVKMLGMCLHHDGGAVGAAVPEGVLERRLRLLKEMGCNAVRTSHNPMAPEFYEMCDRLGLLVMDEIFDEWTVPKKGVTQGYASYFADWYERDLVNFIRRDRNHPSIVMWSAGNEIGEQQAAQGTEILRKLVAIFHREDPTRPVTAGLDHIYNPERGSAPVEFTSSLDIAGYNYVDRYRSRRSTYYADDRRQFPERHFVGTEDTAVRGPRGVYEFRAPSPGTPVRATYATAMIQTAELWKFALTHDYDIGHFIWVGIDYLGESPWPRKNSLSGALDTCGFPKDGYYFYQSIFTSKPMLHIFPHWNWTGREGQVIPVVAYTNCDVVELFLNGRSLGAKAREFPRQGTVRGYNVYAKPQVFPTTADLHLAWDVPYEAGTLKAVGYTDGKVVGETEVRTAGKPAMLRLYADQAELRAGARDVAHLTVQVVDAAGTVVPEADNLVVFDVQGAAKLIGTDNGNGESHESFKDNRRRAFSGLCLGIVQATAQSGEVRITVSADGLKEDSVVLKSTPASGKSPPVILPIP
jgi:beta-galactosidase